MNRILGRPALALQVAPPIARSLPLLALLLLGACNGAAEPVKAPRPVLVEAPTALADGGGEAYPGVVRARVEADLSFRVPGKIAERRVEAGSRVEAGQVLATLDPQDAQLNLEAARAAVAAAEADLKLARSEEQRYRDLLARGYVSQSVLDAQTNRVALSQAQLEQAQASLRLSENSSRYTRLSADRAGVITRVYAEVGTVVAAGTPVFGFAAEGEREVVIAVPEGRLEAVRKAPAVAVRIWSQGERQYPARLRELSPQASPTTRTHEARFTLLEPDASVQLGVTATVLIGSDRSADTFRLPATAVGDQGEGQAVVWVVRAGSPATVEPVAVRPLQYLHDSVIVQAPLKPDDRLVSVGVHLLQPGLPVQPVERSAPAAL